MRSHVVLGLGLLLILLSGCTELPSKNNAGASNVMDIISTKNGIQPGDSVVLYSTGTLDDGSIFDGTQPGSPATFQIGVGKLIVGFDQGLMGMKVGEKKTIVIEPVDAYGEVNAALIQEFDGQELTDANIPLKVGVKVSTSIGGGTIVDVNTTMNKVKVDFNHPLAGQRLTFDVEIVDIKRTLN